MVRSVTGVHHQGVRDWVIQRVSAVLMAVYVIILISYVLFHPNLNFEDWKYFFSSNWVKVSTLLVILGLLYHAWIGMWTIFTDYIKSYLLRTLLNFLVLLMLFACFFWALSILGV